jgi:hypothetical protein
MTTAPRAVASLAMFAVMLDEQRQFRVEQIARLTTAGGPSNRADTDGHHQISDTILRGALFAWPRSMQPERGSQKAGTAGVSPAWRSCRSSGSRCYRTPRNAGPASEVTDERQRALVASDSTHARRTRRDVRYPDHHLLPGRAPQPTSRCRRANGPASLRIRWGRGRRYLAARLGRAARRPLRALSQRSCGCAASGPPPPAGAPPPGSAVRTPVARTGSGAAR